MTLITDIAPHEANALGRVFYDAVRDGARAYTVPQRAAWMPSVPKGRKWFGRLVKMDVIVARQTCGPVGFVAMKPDGYVDFAYLLGTAQGRGIFRHMMNALMNRHPSLPMSTHASLHAQPAFSALGFSIVHHEVVIRNGQRLPRAFMTRA